MPAGHAAFSAGATAGAALGVAEALGTTGAAMGAAEAAEAAAEATDVATGAVVTGGIGVLACSGFPEQATRAKAEARRTKGRITNNVPGSAAHGKRWSAQSTRLTRERDEELGEEPFLRGEGQRAPVALDDLVA
jgi:hypothetical protein